MRQIFKIFRYDKTGIKKEFYNLAKEKMISDDALNGILENGQISFETDISKI